MTKVVAKLRYLRIAPKKVRRIARLLKGMSYLEAEAQLRFLPQKSAKPLAKLLASAGANAEHNFHLDKTDLFIENILVDPGPTLKRIRPRARGMAAPINKRTSHITLFLAPLEGKTIKQVEKEEKEKKVKSSSSSRSKKAPPAQRVMKKERVTKVSETKQRVFRRKAI